MGITEMNPENPTKSKYVTVSELRQLGKLFASDPELPMKVGDRIIETEEELERVACEMFDECLPE